MSRCPRQCSARRCTSASRRAVKPTLPTRCSRRCATSSAATSNGVPRSDHHPDDCHPVAMAEAPPADAFVFFGATGDLAYKQIFPALQGLVRRGQLDMPVVGVAKAGWGLDQLVERARASLTEHGGVDPAAFEQLRRRLQYIDGDYRDPTTFQQVHAALAGAQRPLHYLAI